MKQRPYISILLALGLLFTAAACQAGDDPDPRIIIEPPYRNTAGFGWMTDLPHLVHLSDRQGKLTRSTLVLYEDGKPLWPPHQYHRRIERLGFGRYSHWGRSLWFSSSDNTNPNTNGRVYSYSISGPAWRFPAVTFIKILFGLVMAGCILGPLLLAWLYRGSGAVRWLSCLGLAALGLILFLWANPVHPQAWYSILIHLALLGLLVLSVLGAAFGLSRIRADRPRSRLWVGLAVGWVLVSVTFLGLELFFRLIPFHTSNAINPASKFFWPDWTYYPRNQYGFLDQEPLSPRPGNTYQVLIVGDSFVEGAGLTREQTIGRIMEREANRSLEESGRTARVEVLNWGRSGNNTEENMAVIRNLPPEIRPDLVILEYTLSNDSETHPPLIKRRDPPKWVNRTHDFFLSEVRSYAYYWFYWKFTLFKVMRTVPFQIVSARYEEGFLGWQRTRMAFRDFAVWLNKNDTDGLVIVYPVVRYLPDYPRPLVRIHRKLGQALEENSLEYLDLTSFFAESGVAMDDLLLSRTDAHPSALANRLLGQHLARELFNRSDFTGWLSGIP